MVSIKIPINVSLSIRLAVNDWTAASWPDDVRETAFCGGTLCQCYSISCAPSFGRLRFALGVEGNAVTRRRLSQDT
jgi:hypothetical protein